MRFRLQLCVAIFVTASLSSIDTQATAQTTKPTQTTPTQPPAVSRESLAGEYDGNQMEVAARLLLQPNGHFTYELAYGALDESAEGTWELKDGAVFLTTVPAANSPRFAVVGDQLNQNGSLCITHIGMKGVPQRIYLIYGPNEPREMVDVDAYCGVPLPGNHRPTAFIPVVPGYPIMLKSIPLTGTTGHYITLGFDPSGGKADFRLTIANGVLVMPRRDLQLMLNFKRETRH